MKSFYKTWRCLTCAMLLFSCFSVSSLKAQNAVVIGGNTPNPNAVLLLVGNGNQGLAIPITSDPTSIAKVQGMIVFNKTDNTVYFCDGSSWKAVGTGSGSGSSQTLTLAGNTVSISGGNSVTIASSAPTQAGQILMWDGSKWTSSSTTAPTVTGQVLKWNNTTKSWEAGTDAGGTSYIAGTGIAISGTTISNTGVTTVSGTAPLSVLTPTTTPAISITQAGTTADGYLSKTDWNTFSGKLDLTSTPGAGDIGGSYSAGFQIGAGAILNADINTSAAIAGTKINPDFGSQNITTTGKTILNTVTYTWPGAQGGANTFLKNDGTGNVSWVTNSGGGISNVSGTGPISVANPSTAPDISISQASTSVDGYLSKTDFTTFNGKLDVSSTPSAGDITGSYTAGLQLGAGAILNADVNASAAIAGTKISPNFGTQDITTTGKTIFNTVPYIWPGTQGSSNTYLKNDGAGNVTWSTVSGSGVTSVSGTSPITVTNATTTPGISISQASTSVDGYLSKTDFTTFNGKLDASSTPAAGDIGGSFTAGFQLGAGSIVNADVNATAAIAGTKITPNFGTQDITTTGKTILNTVSYTWPGTQGAANTFLRNDGSGNFSWVASSGFSTDKIIPRGNGTGLVASQLYDDGTKVGIGTITPAKKLDVAGDINISTGSGIYSNSLLIFKTDANFDVFAGESSGIVSTGGFNSFFGWQAGGKNTSGTYNTFVGHAAGFANTTGSYEVYVGGDAGFTMASGDLNTFLGFDAGYTSNGVTADTYLGNKAGLNNTTGSFNVFVGEKAGQTNTTGAENTFIGRQSGATNTTGQQNTLLGSLADVGAAGLQNATAIGYNTKVKSSNTVALGNAANVEISNNNYFGYLTTDNYTIDGKTFGNYGLGWASDSWNVAGNTAWLSGYAGIKLFTDGSNVPKLSIQQLGNVGVGTATPSFLLDVNGSLRCFAFTNSSDIRWKKDIYTLNNSLDKILRLRGVEYSWKKEELKNTQVEDGRQIGFIAQEVEAIIPELVSTDKEGFKSVKYANITAVLVEAVKEQQSQIDALKKTIEALEAKLKLYETKESEELSVIHAEIKKLTELVGLEASAEKK